ncbi:MAG: anaerobic ribonucleoside-triphosphate reductase, partial [Bacillota bacterium]
NSDMDPEDARSMCLHPEETILIKEDNKISKYTMKELFKKYKDKKIDDEWYHVSSKIKALSLNPETGKVEWVDISKLLEIKDDRLITITAKDGKTMKVSADHIVAVYSEKGIATKKASQVNKDDFLLVLQDASDVLNNDNSKVTNELAWFMGLFMADGNYLYDSRYNKKIFRGVQITFNKQDNDLINKTKDFIKKHLNYDMKFILDPRYDNSLRGYIYNSNFAKNLNHKFSLKKYHKLPEWIWTSSTDTITSFIKGFFAGDGYELGKEIHINDQPLAIELNLLFQLVGISTTINFKDNSQVIRIQHVLGRGANNKKVIRDKLHNLIPQYLLDPKFVKDKNGNNLYQSYGCKMVGLSTIDRWKISNEKIEFLRNANFAVTEVKEIKREKLNFQQLFYDIELEKNHYFVHSDGNITHNCCRLRLDNRQLRKRGGGLFGANPLTGSIGVVTINLPRIGYLAKSKEDYLNRVFELMDLAKESLEIKRKVLEDLTEKNLYPYSKFYLEGVKKRFDQYWKNHFNTIGINGMNESLLNLMGKNIASEEGNEFAVEVMQAMKEKMVEYQEETDNLYNLEATPAESTAYRLAKLDKEQIGYDIICANQKRYEDEDADPYYTNSSQLPVDYTGDIFEALSLQDELQSEYTGGTVFHGFLGEKMPDIESTKLLVKRIAENFKLPYYTITPTFSICPVHGYLSGEHKYCPKCEAEAARDDN